MNINYSSQTMKIILINVIIIFSVNIVYPFMFDKDFHGDSIDWASCSSSIKLGVSHFSPKSSNIKDTFGSGINYDLMATYKLSKSLSLLMSGAYFKKDMQDKQTTLLGTRYETIFTESYVMFVVINETQEDIIESDYTIIPILANIIYDVPFQSNNFILSLGLGAGINIVKQETSIIQKYVEFYTDTNGSPVTYASNILTTSKSDISDTPLSSQILAILNYRVSNLISFDLNLRYLISPSSSSKFDTDLGGFYAGGGVNFLFNLFNKQQ